MSGRTAHESNRRREQWTWRDGLVIVSIVALGTVVAAVTNEGTGTSIPGCESVESPGPPVRINYGFTGEPGYDDPDYPWFSGPKATAMSDALLESLPSDVDVAFASPSKSLEFAPIDPWDFESRWYEQRKYALSAAMLPKPRYRRAFEPGCSIDLRRRDCERVARCGQRRIDRAEVGE